MKQMTMTSTPAIGLGRHALSPASNRPRMLEIIAGTLTLWRARATQRDRLQDIDDHLLADMGLSRADVDRERRKPFWRA